VQEPCAADGQEADDVGQVARQRPADKARGHVYKGPGWTDSP
jgi:hypothetical protein